MVGAEDLLANMQSSPVQGLGLFEPAHGHQRLGCEAEVVGHVGMFGAEGCLISVQRPLVQGQGFTRAAQGGER